MKILYASHGNYWGSTWPYEFIDNFIISNLKKLGHEVRVFDIFFRANMANYFLTELSRHRQWTEAKKLLFLDDRATSDLPLEVIDFQPDLVLHIVGRLTPKVLKALKFLKVKSAIWFLDDPQEIDKTSKLGTLYDAVFTVEEGAVKAYQENGNKKVAYLPLACDPDVHKTIPVEEKYQSDICFIGVPFPERAALFDELADFLSKYNVKIIGGLKAAGGSNDPWLWKTRLKKSQQLEKFILDEIVPPQEAIKYYNGAKINLNFHRISVDERFPAQNSRQIEAVSVNGRTFEIAGCGAFQLIDDKRKNVFDLFEDKKDLVVFDSIEDLKKKIVYYLKHEKERKAIAAAGQQKAYKEHTYTNRLEKILKIASSD